MIWNRPTIQSLSEMRLQTVLTVQGRSCNGCQVSMRLSGGSDPLAYIGQSITQRLDFRVTSIHLWSQPVAKRPTEHGFLFGGHSIQ